MNCPCVSMEGFLEETNAYPGWPLDFFEFLLQRHEQYWTSFHTRAHFLRHWNPL